MRTDLPHISFIFTGRSIGYALGSIVGGVLFEYLHPLLLISVTLAMSGIGLIIMPHFVQLRPAIFIISLVGLANGALDTGKKKSETLPLVAQNTLQISRQSPKLDVLALK